MPPVLGKIHSKHSRRGLVFVLGVRQGVEAPLVFLPFVVTLCTACLADAVCTRLSDTMKTSTTVGTLFCGGIGRDARRLVSVR